MKVSQILFALMANTAIATWPKANEYTDHACSNFNYGHHQQHLSTVTMDETTHSVYLNGGNGFWTGTKYFWLGFSEKGDDGQCRGEQLGQLPSDGDCVNLDAHFSQRINCLRLSNNG